MRMLNRGALILRPREPFRDWVNSHDDSVEITIAELRSDSSVYLIDDVQDAEEAFRALGEDGVSLLFAEELAAYSTDTATWPSDLSVENFEDWFEIEFNSMVFDLGIARLEYEPDA